MDQVCFAVVHYLKEILHIQNLILIVLPQPACYAGTTPIHSSCLPALKYWNVCHTHVQVAAASMLMRRIAGLLHSQHQDHAKQHKATGLWVQCQDPVLSCYVVYHATHNAMARSATRCGHDCFSAKV